MSFQNKTRPRRFAATTLLVATALSSSIACAMESIPDEALSDVTGADGVAIDIQASQIKFGTLFFKDSIDHSANTSTLTMSGASLTNGNNAAGTAAGGQIASNLQLNTGSSGGIPALGLKLNVYSSLLFTAPTITLCSTAAACSGLSLGSLAVQTTDATDTVTNTPTNPDSTGTPPNKLHTPTSLSFTTTKGFLNSAGTATVTLLLDGANIFFSSNGNQIVTSDIRANINASGRIWVDSADGFRFSGAVQLPAFSDSRAGLQASIMMQNSTGNTLATSTPSATNTPPNGLIRFGVSGNLPTLDLTLRGNAGVSDSAANGGADTIGNVVGTSGIAARMTATIQSGTSLSHNNGNANTNTGNGFELELGAAGAGGYGIRMSNFVPFSNVMGSNPTIDSGNIYLNLVNKTSVTMPVPAGLTGGTANLSANYYGLTATDTQAISTTATDNLLFAVRGLSIQGVSLSTSFYQNGVGHCTGTTTCTTGPAAATGFAIMPVLYGVSGNLALSANTANSLGYSIGLAMAGNNGGLLESGTTPGTGPSSDIQESAIFLANTGTQNNSQYVGLRDINFYFKANGVITLNGSTNGVTHRSTNDIKITMPNFRLAMSANFAGGYLPGTENTGLTNGVARSGYALFSSNKDTIETINLSLQGDANNANNYIDISTSSATPSTLGLSADLTLAGAKSGTAPDQTLAANNFIRIVEPTSGAALGFDNITGRIQLGAGSQISVGPNSGTFTAAITVNPANVLGGELLTTLNLYAGSAAPALAPQTLGKMVITGGTLLSSMTLRPCTISGAGATFSCS